MNVRVDKYSGTIAGSRCSTVLGTGPVVQGAAALYFYDAESLGGWAPIPSPLNLTLPRPAWLPVRLRRST
jgi:hypothetical protein